MGADALRPPNLIQHALSQNAVGTGLVALAGLLQPGVVLAETQQQVPPLRRRIRSGSGRNDSDSHLFHSSLRLRSE
jgi:hypothetical protein